WPGTGLEPEAPPSEGDSQRSFKREGRPGGKSHRRQVFQRSTGLREKLTAGRLVRGTLDLALDL
ncbi:MAG TPA: hypothetical protein PK408_03435, partial [Treponemataceae bacterium]|nr:hypothetical protein [Treponemataceae bacterium]